MIQCEYSVSYKDETLVEVVKTSKKSFACHVVHGHKSAEFIIANIANLELPELKALFIQLSHCTHILKSADKPFIFKGSSPLSKIIFEDEYLLGLVEKQTKIALKKLNAKNVIT